MKERPILFGAPMVCAILDGTKTQTRRALKFQNEQVTILTEGGMLKKVAIGIGEAARWLPCPYGQPGDRLWVKETWCTAWGLDKDAPRALAKGSPIQYQADGAEAFTDAWDSDERHDYGRIRQSIFMRRWMSRITLEIVSVRVERLNDISGQDALAEGCAIDKGHTYVVAGHEHFAHRTAVGCYMTLWGQLNGAGSWAANPWVWVIEFRRVET